jgi:hypothetical protein
MVRSGEWKNKQNTHPEKETESLSKKKNGLFFLAPCSLSSFFETPPHPSEREGPPAAPRPSPFSETPRAPERRREYHKSREGARGNFTSEM